MNQSSKLELIQRYHGYFLIAATFLQPAVLLALRLTWGWQLAESGYGHLTHYQQTVDAFRGWGVPMPEINVYISAFTEITGGVLLMLGLGARLFSIPLVFNFIVAYASASRDTFKELFQGMLQKGYDDFINDAAFPFLMLALIMIAFGPGKASIDYLLQRTVFAKRKAATGFPMDS
jgi:putative oxidoreductase